jgi:hypothetical protein
MSLVYHTPSTRRHRRHLRPHRHFSGADSVWPRTPPKGYLGQLEPTFQARLDAMFAPMPLESCDFYHTSTLSDGRVLPGAWDLRGAEADYLGHVPFGGRRVLELGPASGHLTYYMESLGAEVVSFDAGWDATVDVLPRPDIDRDEVARDVMRMIARVQGAWWHLHRDRQSSAKAAYGNIYALPRDLGPFHVSVFGAILLHLSNPFQALCEAAARTTETIVVTDALQDPSLDADDNVMRFASAGFSNLTVWWTITPGTVVRMLRHLGFEKTTVTYHSQRHHLAHDLEADPVDMAMFTVVGERT